MIPGWLSTEDAAGLDARVAVFPLPVIHEATYRDPADGVAWTKQGEAVDAPGTLVLGGGRVIQEVGKQVDNGEPVYRVTLQQREAYAVVLVDWLGALGLYDYEHSRDGGVTWKRLASAKPSPYGAAKPLPGDWYRFRAAHASEGDWWEAAGPVAITHPPELALKIDKATGVVTLTITPRGPTTAVYRIETGATAAGPWTLAASGSVSVYELGALAIGSWLRVRVEYEGGICTATLTKKVAPATPVIPHAQWEITDWRTVRIPWP